VRRDTKITAAVLSSVPLAILGLSSVCAWAVAHGASPRWRMLFRLFCHGIERRCLTLFDVAMPICARCTGIYTGLLAGLAIFVFRPSITRRFAAVALAIATAALALDGLTQATGLRESTNTLRLITGLGAGIAFGIWVLSAIEHHRTEDFASS
jgi:uncharacterized membrane protein